MTYYNTAAARCAVKRYAVAAIVGVLGSALSGCGTAGGILGSNGTAANANKATALLPAAQPTRARIAIATIIGAPDTVSRQLTASLTRAITAQRVAVSKTKGEPVDYTLRGYVVAAKEGRATKLSYIWDVTNPAGTRVNRITGEQTINGSSTRDPWTAVSPAVIQTIADKTASSFGTWLPNKPAQQAVASSAARTSAAGPGSALAPTGSATTTAASTARSGTPRPQLAALKPASKPAYVFALVPSVSGAPGDGRVSLTTALRNALKRNGIILANRPSAAAYQVIGKVAVGKVSAGQQQITIDWHVKDPKGNALGTVSQKNKIPQGSLNGPWGKTATAAAGAAAQGILKLLPKPPHSG